MMVIDVKTFAELQRLHIFLTPTNFYDTMNPSKTLRRVYL